ncbi:RluA family pseudouridine synthase [Siminovitchia sediminis]|uniref:RNA pseudouridylate synthase n=1 Tax=Siminovitchia sediminis TaxID=1274353 RepID=A0ABW4KDB7_9BACI
MEISIIYEDNHLLVVEKPVNVPVQEDQSGDKDLLTMLKADLKDRYQKPGNVFLGLVHRLDRPVGGVMVFAKTSKAASRLSDSIRRNQLNRGYLAVVRGIPNEEEARLEHYLLKNHRENRVKTVSAQHKQGKRAVLDYQTLARTNALSLLSVHLHTGRSHQIRVQLSAIGCPLYGDQKYGRQVNKPGEQIALWANYLKIEHPTKKEWMTFESYPPEQYPWNLFKVSEKI